MFDFSEYMILIDTDTDQLFISPVGNLTWLSEQYFYLSWK